MNPTDVRPFVATGNTVTISATGTSSVTAITVSRAANPDMPGTYRVYNAGPDIAWVKPGTSGSTAAKTSDTAIPVAPGNTETFWLPADATHLAVIAQTSAATVYATPGQGS